MIKELQEKLCQLHLLDQCHRFQCRSYLSNVCAQRPTLKKKLTECLACSDPLAVQLFNTPTAIAFKNYESPIHKLSAVGMTSCLDKRSTLKLYGLASDLKTIILSAGAPPSKRIDSISVSAWIVHGRLDASVGRNRKLAEIHWWLQEWRKAKLNDEWSIWLLAARSSTRGKKIFGRKGLVLDIDRSNTPMHLRQPELL